MELLDILPPGSDAQVESLEREQILPALSIDHAYRVSFGGRVWIEHLEAQAWYHAEIPARLALYKHIIWYKHREDVESVLVMIQPANTTVPDSYELKRAELEITARYRVVRIWELPAERALRRDHPSLWPLVPLMRSTREQVMEAADWVAVWPDRKVADDVANRLFVLTGLRYDGEETARLLEKIYMLIPDEVLFQSSVFKKHREAERTKGREEGRMQALRDLIREQIGRFPTLPQPDTSMIMDAQLLKALVYQTTGAQTEEEMRRVVSTLHQ